MSLSVAIRFNDLKGGRALSQSMCAGLLGTFLLAGCAPSVAVATLPEDPTLLAVASPTAPPPTEAATPTHLPPTPSLEPPGPPPPTFSTKELRPGVEPVSYLEDTCQYLRLRWDPEGSSPGTVVLPIMFHSIREPDNMPDDTVTISTDTLAAIVQEARQLGFETITAAQLEAFLTRNARIPRRSMLFIMDDRYPGPLAQYVMPVLQANNWTATLGWIIGDTRPSLWSVMEDLAKSGRLDVQSHGYQHLYITDAMSDDELRQEISGSIPILEEHFGSRPIAFVWPGGNFTPRAVQIARQAGYELGFTASSRGPLLFNWIPLTDVERAADDPVMVLPRAWSTAAVVSLAQAARVGDAATEQAEQNRQAETEWFERSCGGPLPGS
jgi:peptidoglycan/xylan/chitin deacetylase (PgdA/CDA1 family)